jgi:hypothetical protein
LSFFFFFVKQFDDEQRKKMETEHQEAMEKKKHHAKINHPGSVDQMEEVWEDVDHLEADQFNPKTFFQMHDVNGDAFLDEGEIEAIMLKDVGEKLCFSLRRHFFVFYFRQKKFMMVHQKLIQLKNKKKWTECVNML